jgi:hypothetical protein
MAIKRTINRPEHRGEIIDSGAIFITWVMIASMEKKLDNIYYECVADVKPWDDYISAIDTSRGVLSRLCVRLKDAMDLLKEVRRDKGMHQLNIFSFF